MITVVITVPYTYDFYSNMIKIESVRPRRLECQLRVGT